MKKITFFILIFIFLSIISVCAQEDKKEEIPPGMELLEMGAAKVVVPVGTKVSKVGSLIILENDSEYMSRRFLEMEERLAELEAKEEELKKDVERLKQALDEMQKEEPTSEDKQGQRLPL